MPKRVMVAALLAAGAVLAAGCGGTKPCKTGTVLLTVSYGAAAPPDHLIIDAKVQGGAPAEMAWPPVPGVDQRIEVDFPGGYPKGKPIEIHIVAYQQDGTPIGSGSAQGMLAEGCQVFSVAVKGGQLGQACTAAGDCASGTCTTGRCGYTLKLADPVLLDGKKDVSVVVADFTGDGLPDIAGALSDDSTVAVFVNQGSGKFAAPVIFTVSDSPTSLAILDRGSDGKHASLLAATPHGDAVILLANAGGTGSGIFKAPVAISCGPGCHPLLVAAGDWNGDGKPDLVTTDSDYRTAGTVLLNQGGNSFGSPTMLSAVGIPENGVAVADVNGDKKLDVLIAQTGGPISDGTFDNGQIAVLLGGGDGTFMVGNPIKSSNAKNPFTLAVADLNGDGAPDYATANQAEADMNSVLMGGNLAVYLSQGGGQVGVPKTFFDNVSFAAVAVTDLDGDKRPEVVSADFYNATLVVLQNQGKTGFQTMMWKGAPDQCFAIGAEDVNGDGLIDLVLGGRNGTMLYLNQSK